MPRLSPSLLLQAHKIHALLPLLLRPCRDLQSAQNELRWLREHALAITSSSRDSPNSNRYLRTVTGAGWRTNLRQLCEQRARGVPLQYLLGSQPFGALDIKCRRGVLIPRPETEAYTTHLAHQILRFLPSTTTGKSFRILDLCTGTGCIALLLHSLLHPRIPNLQITGIDISPLAIGLARQNLASNIAQNLLSPAAKDQVSFNEGNAFDTRLIASSGGGKQGRQRSTEQAEGGERRQAGSGCGCGSEWDVIISNPPYISPEGYKRTTSRSVRNFEPRLALVPPSSASVPISTAPISASTSTSILSTSAPAPALKSSQSISSTTTTDADRDGDTFYPSLLQHAAASGAQFSLLEVADLAQAKRVVRLATAQKGVWDVVEIWRDWPAQQTQQAQQGLGSGLDEYRSCGGIEAESKGERGPRTGEAGVVAGREMVKGMKGVEEGDVPVRGQGNGRAVVCWRAGGGSAWFSG
ncbi:MAG: hypothetical protein M1819_006831 [Sarea resinae]|nr:MAG: hypothetical protein M1819_006831 [Sarea resinae]